jgi:hypothetical protein
VQTKQLEHQLALNINQFLKIFDRLFKNGYTSTVCLSVKSGPLSARTGEKLLLQMATGPAHFTPQYFPPNKTGLSLIGPSPKEKIREEYLK